MCVDQVDFFPFFVILTGLWGILGFIEVGQRFTIAVPQRRFADLDVELRLTGDDTLPLTKFEAERHDFH